MDSPIFRYRDVIQDCFNAVVEDDGNLACIRRASSRLAEVIKTGHLVYVAGVGGHANLCAGECLYRAGMLVQLSPMLDMTSLTDGCALAQKKKTLPGFARESLERYHVTCRDAVIILNAYSTSHLTVDLALEARRMGASTVGIGSRAFAEEKCSGHVSGKKLYDVVDTYIDCKMAPNDTAVSIAGVEPPVAPTSTLCMLFSLHLLLLEAIRFLAESGVKPDIWKSINLSGGDEENAAYIKEYAGRIRFLE